MQYDKPAPDATGRGAIGNRRTASTAGADHYPTPPWAVRALLSQETFDGVVHEPCCGLGNMVSALQRAGLQVVPSDLHDYGCGSSGIDARQLKAPVANVVTNPPYKLAEEMLRHFITIYTRKIALLLRLSFLESKKRYPLFQAHPPTRVYVFTERLSMAAHGEVVRGGGTISYGWFLWENGAVGETALRWLPMGFKCNE